MRLSVKFGPSWGAYSTPTDPLAASKGRGKADMGREE